MPGPGSLTATVGGSGGSFGERHHAERGRCGCPRLALPGVGDAGGDMSEEEEGAKGCRFAFSAEVVIYAECVHICVHGVCMDWLSAWVG